MPTNYHYWSIFPKKQNLWMSFNVKCVAFAQLFLRTIDFSYESLEASTYHKITPTCPMHKSEHNTVKRFVSPIHLAKYLHHIYRPFLPKHKSNFSNFGEYFMILTPIQTAIEWEVFVTWKIQTNCIANVAIFPSMYQLSSCKVKKWVHFILYSAVCRQPFGQCCAYWACVLERKTGQGRNV